MPTALPPPASLAAAAAEAAAWLRDDAAPLWSRVGWHPRGLFAERLSLDGVADVCPRRVFVQARQIYAFCKIGELGWAGPWREKAGAAMDHVLAHARRPDGAFIHAFDADGEPQDLRVDLYDQAFLLFCFAHAGTLLDRPALFEEAEALADRLESDWRRPGGGFWEGEIVDARLRRQNPHMHLLEAFAALEAATGRPRWRGLADEIVELCRDRFLDRDTGALLEYYDDALSPLAGERGRIVEPGHCSEWTWLFEILAARGRPDVLPLADRLIGFARAHGVDPARGVMIAEVLTDGSVHDARARLWPQTERLKAALARLRRTGDPAEAEEALAAFAGLRRFLDVPLPGTWRDKSLPGGGWVEEPAPASSLYHITCALTELIETATGRAVSPGSTDLRTPTVR